MSLTVHLEFQPRDLWIGVYYEQRHNDQHALVLPDPVVIEWHVWICLVPCLPIHLVHTRLVASRVAGIDP
jgi:hypothetical protein